MNPLNLKNDLQVVFGVPAASMVVAFYDSNQEDGTLESSVIKNNGFVQIRRDSLKSNELHITRDSTEVKVDSQSYLEDFYLKCMNTHNFKIADGKLLREFPSCKIEVCTKDHTLRIDCN